MLVLLHLASGFGPQQCSDNEQRCDRAHLHLQVRRCLCASLTFDFSPSFTTFFLGLLQSLVSVSVYGSPSLCLSCKHVVTTSSCLVFFVVWFQFQSIVLLPCVCLVNMSLPPRLERRRQRPASQLPLGFELRALVQAYPACSPTHQSRRRATLCVTSPPKLLKRHFPRATKEAFCEVTSFARILVESKHGRVAVTSQAHRTHVRRADDKRVK